MEKKDEYHFECCKTAGARRASLSILETADSGFFTHSHQFTENALKRRKYLVSSRSLGENALLMPEVRDESQDS